MRNSWGSLNIYVLAFGSLLLIFSMPAAGFFIIWEIIIPHGLMIWSWAAPLTAIIFVALTLFFFNYYKPIYKDIRSGLSYAAGSIRDKFVEKGSTPYGIIINYHIVVNNNDFVVSERIYNWIGVSEKAIVHYWPSTLKVCRVDKDMLEE